MADHARSDAYPPEVERIADMGPCHEEGHAPFCPCGYGGDPIVTDHAPDARWNEDADGFVVEPLDWKGELGNA